MSNDIHRNIAITIEDMGEEGWLVETEFGDVSVTQKEQADKVGQMLSRAWVSGFQAGSMRGADEALSAIERITGLGKMQ